MKRLLNNYLMAAAVGLCAVSAASVPVAVPSSEQLAKALSAAKPVSESPRTIAACGQTFCLRTSSAANGVETDEYELEGQTSENWSELITCQRLMLEQSLNADEYVELLRLRLQTSDPTARLRVVQKSPSAAVFGIEYRAEDPSECQLSLVLVTAAGAHRSREIQVVQYTAQPSRLSGPDLQTHANYWKTHFESQALLTRSETIASTQPHSRN